MKRLLTILALFLSSICLAQNQGPNTVRIKVPVSASLMDSALVTVPPECADKNCPLIVFGHGQGQQGNNLDLIIGISDGGPAYQIAHNNWPSSFTNPSDGLPYQFIVVSPQTQNGQSPTSLSAVQFNYLVDYMIANYHIDKRYIFHTGLSAGGEGVLVNAAKMDGGGNPITVKYKTQIAPMSAEFNATYEQRIGDSIADRSLPAWAIGATDDVHGNNTLGVAFYANQRKAGSMLITTYTGGHCCWGQFYNPTFRQGGMSLYEWALSNPLNSNLDSWAIGLGEYSNNLLNETTGDLYDYTTVQAVKITAIPNVVSISGGPHHQAAVTASGRMATKGDNPSGALMNGTVSLPGDPVTPYTIVPIDTLGNTFDNIAMAICSGTTHGNFWNTIVLKKNGDIYVAGNTQGGLLGNGTYGTLASVRPVLVPLPGGRKAKKIQGNIAIVALATDGTVWTWGGDGNQFMLGQGTATPTWMSPGQVTLPVGRTAVDITGAGSLWYIKLDNGHILGQTLYGDYLGVGAGQGAFNSPQDITTALNLQAPVKCMAVNNAGTYAVLTDGTAWGWGSNVMGSFVTGSEADYMIYGSPPLYGATKFPYKNDQGLHQLMLYTPVRIMPGFSNFDTVYADGKINWSFALRTTDKRVFMGGRNKNQLMNGIQEAQSSDYPNSADVFNAEEFIFDSLSTPIIVPSPYCKLNPASSLCSFYSIPATANPHSSAGTNQSLASGTTAFTLTGTYALASGVRKYKTLWSRVSGPNTPLITLNTARVTTVTGATNGTYVYKYWIQDQNLNVDSTTVTITISGNAPPNVNAGTDQTITLPTSSKTLSGSGSAVSPATSVALLWTKVSGPGATTITNNTTATPTVSGLQQGVYVFNLRVTDNNSLVSNDTVQVTVNAAPAVGCTNCLTFPKRVNPKQ